LRYVARRLLLFVPTLVGASILIFVLLRLVPGDIAEILVYQTGSEASAIQQKQIRQIRAELGLDRPVVVQYLDWLGGALRGTSVGRTCRSAPSPTSSGSAYRARSSWRS